jgi:broad specificity phosphatase PhoE
LPSRSPGGPAGHRLGDADACFTSPALRAVQTAEALGLTATIEPALADCDHGRWRGRRLEEIEPAALAEWLRDPAATPHGGESVVALIARVAGWLDQRIGIPGTTVAVTHASVIRAAIVAAIRAGPDSYRHIDVAPLTLARLSGHGGRWTLVGIGPAGGE